MNRFENFKAGLIKDNPVFSLFLRILFNTSHHYTVNNAIGMGVSVIIVFIMSTQSFHVFVKLRQMKFVFQFILLLSQLWLRSFKC